MTIDGSTTPALPLWAAPTAGGGVDATTPLPGSKSLTNRLLVLAALADGTSRLRAPLRSRDTLLMAQALRQLGAQVVDEPVTTNGVDADWTVTPLPYDAGAVGPDVDVDCGLAGTVMRFLPPAAAVGDRSVRMDGDARARERPMLPVITALRELGVRVEDEGRGTLPLTVHGAGLGGVRGGQVRLDASASSQFVSALLLAGARFTDGVDVHHIGPPMPSQPHVSMTVAVLEDVGVRVESFAGPHGPDRWRVYPGPISPVDTQVEPDLSNAAPFLAAAVVTGGRVTVPGWPQSTTQAGDALRDLLDEMGADVSLEQAGLTVRGTGELYGVDVDLHDVGELTPVIAALAALAQGPTRIRGIAHLRGHETDRLAALETELNELGGDVSQTEDGLSIRPRPLRAGGPRNGRFVTYHDHRMAMAGAVIGLAVPGVMVEDVDTTAKTLPGFADRWQAMVDTAGTS